MQQAEIDQIATISNRMIDSLREYLLKLLYEEFPSNMIETDLMLNLMANVLGNLTGSIATRLGAEYPNKSPSVKIFVRDNILKQITQISLEVAKQNEKHLN